MIVICKWRYGRTLSLPDDRPRPSERLAAAYAEALAAAYAEALAAAYAEALAAEVS